MGEQLHISFHLFIVFGILFAEFKIDDNYLPVFHHYTVGTASLQDSFFLVNDGTKPQFINYGIDDFNYALSKAHYFETEIKRQGIILYDSGEYKLARRRKLNFDEIQERAQKYYDDNFKPKAIEFILLNIDSYNRKNYKMASFNLHQATENLLRIIELVFTLYSPKEHRLTELMNRCKRFTTEIFKAFPRDTPEEERLFKLLERAYVESRYNPDFEITKEDIDALLPKVERLRDIVERVCTAQIDYYARQKNK